MGISRAVTKSRVGRRPVSIPSGVQVSINNGVISVKGQKGTLTHSLHPLVGCEINDAQQITFFNSDKQSESSFALHIPNMDRKTYRSIVGTTRVVVSNMIKGVTDGFSKTLNLIGVGYRAQLKSAKHVTLNLGYSNPVEFIIPDGITIEIPVPTEIIIKGVDKFLVGQVADDIRSNRLPECYKGKGIRYQGEQVRIKEVKKK